MVTLTPASLGVELEMVVACRKDGASHCVGPFFSNLYAAKRARGEAAQIETAEDGRDIAVISALGYTSIAVASAQRDPLLPNVPTVAESGVPGFATSGWIGLLAPARTPPQIVDQLHTAVAKALKSEAVKKRMSELAFTPIGNSPAEFQTFLSKEVALWGGVAAKAGVQKE